MTIVASFDVQKLAYASNGKVVLRNILHSTTISISILCFISVYEFH